jgi:enamine deaminase RidA (YjgF/YER057c/UK114 family)
MKRPTTAALGPAPTAPVAAFLPSVRSGNSLFLSGHIAKKDGKPWTGQLGRDLTTEKGKTVARATAIDALGTLHAAVSDLHRAAHIVKTLCPVNSTPRFPEQHLVANGASQLQLDAFGEKGTHARSAFGAAQIPLGSCAEIELAVELG